MNPMPPATPLTANDVFVVLGMVSIIVGMFATRFEHNALRERVRNLEEAAKKE